MNMDSNCSVNNVEERFVCEICDKKFLYKTSLFHHKSSHTTVRPYNCEKCGIWVKTKTSLLRHLHSHTVKQAFICKICNKCFSGEKQFSVHRLKHIENASVNFQVDNIIAEKVAGNLLETFEEQEINVIEQKLQNVPKAADVLTNSTFTVVNEKLSLIDNNVIASGGKSDHCDKDLDLVNIENVTKLKNDLNSITNRKSDENVGRNIFTCNLCQKVFRQKQSLQNHFLYHRGKNPFLCDKCGKSFMKKITLTKHLKKHEINEFPCEICGKHFTQMRFLKCHLTIHTGEKPHDCEQCGLKFRLRKALLRHVEDSHAVPVCEQDLIHKDLTSHNSPGNLLYICKFCGQSFYSIKLHDEHIAYHDSSYTCHICGLAFSRRKNLSQHIRVHSSHKPFGCEICGTKFKVLSHLKGHFIAHKKYKPHACDICDQTFRTKRCLSNHYLIHTGEKPYSCEICHKTFRTQTQRRVHYRTHTGEHPHACDVCGKKFINKNSLSDHIVTHGTEKPYNCKICGKNYFSEKRLSAHCLTHHPKFKCNVCGKVFKLKGELNRHYCVVDVLPSVCE